ncbi:FAD-dependent oxidoreductase [Pseudonocardiaceae bacterium YIM PH 21723]|nr:FAD-dependent oxidoreductase [Pseudonocardiaceae bacterium YIM PH 21723]
MTRRVLISGASIAGPALAYWLQRHGFQVTLVERAPGLRPGGQAIDIRGVALDVVERMGLLDSIREQSTRQRGFSTMSPSGKELLRITEFTPTGGSTGNPDVEIMKSDLTELLYAATKDHAEYRFGDSISALAEDTDGVTVTFAGGNQERFDLVVGADGVHSGVRELAFGSDEDYLHPLGMHLAIFSMENVFGLDYWQAFCRTPGQLNGIYSARDNTEARGAFGFYDPGLRIDYRDTERQMAVLEERFTDRGWASETFLKAMREAPDFYFDSMALVKMEHWSTGRVVLVGDAGYCATPFSGQGTSLALVGAYVLAGELAAADGAHRVAFGRYERVLREFVLRNQALAQSSVRAFQSGRFTLWIQVQVLRLVSRLPFRERLYSRSANPLESASRALALPAY